jgi:hypothetical protein
MGQPKLVWSGNEIPLSPDYFASEAESASVAHMNQLYKDFDLYHYRGFTALSSLDRTDDDYSIIAASGLFATAAEFIRQQLPGDGHQHEFLQTNVPDREAALQHFCKFVDRNQGEGT